MAPPRVPRCLVGSGVRAIGCIDDSSICTRIRMPRVRPRTLHHQPEQQIGEWWRKDCGVGGGVCGWLRGRGRCAMGACVFGGVFGGQRWWREDGRQMVPVDH